MARKKMTLYVEAEILRSLRRMATRAGKQDSDIVEEALKRYLGIDILERVGARSDLDERRATELAYNELHRSRKEPGLG